MSIITLTINPALDSSTSVLKVVPDHKLKCKQPKHDPGGGGINVARAIKRLGGQPTAIFQSSGAAGALLEQLLNKENIRSITFTTKEWTRENFIVMDESGQKQYRFGMPGPTYSIEETETCFNLIQQIDTKPEYLVLSGSLAPGIPDDFYAKICHWAENEGVKIILDTSGTPLKKAMQIGVYLAKPNLKELCKIVGKEIISSKEQEAIALSLIHQKKAKIIVVSLGSKGAMMASEKGIEYISPPTVVIKSTVGAGDSMVAGMVWALEKGLTQKDVLRYGVACGTAATMNSGTELCRKEDVEMVLNWFKRVD